MKKQRDPAPANLSVRASRQPKVCPECQHVFQGNGWDGIDAHWKAKHESAMPYKEAWPLIQTGTYNGVHR